MIDYERDAKLIKLMYPREVEGKVIDLRGDNRMAELCEMREQFGMIEKANKKAKETVETEMREKLGDAKIAIVQGWKVTLRTTQRKEKVVPAGEYRTLRTVREKVE